MTQRVLGYRYSPPWHRRSGYRLHGPIKTSAECCREFVQLDYGMVGGGLGLGGGGGVETKLKHRQNANQRYRTPQ